MNEQLKQRLVGAMVIVALAVIFLPSLFHKDERVPLDTTSEIPLAPQVESVVIAPPVRPDNIPEPDDQLRFQPELVEDDKAASKPTVAAKISVKPEKSRLSESGVPLAWVVQAGSFKSKESAEKLIQSLIEDDFKAYSKLVSTDKGEFIRVFVGPFIERTLALEAKQKVDQAYQVKAQVLRFNPASGD